MLGFNGGMQQHFKRLVTFPLTKKTMVKVNNEKLRSIC